LDVVEEISAAGVPTLSSCNSTIYRIAKQPAHPNTTLQRIETAHGATDFLLALTKFLTKFLPHAPPPSCYDRFDVYRQITLNVPFNRHLSLKQRNISRIHATPPSPAKGRAPPTSSHFDTGLIIKDPDHYSLSPSLQGLRVGQIRVIFKLPAQFGHFAHPLAYIEWFTPLGNKDRITGMYQVSRSTRTLHRNSEILSVSRIARSCHLIAKCLREIDHSWTSENVLEKGKVFWVNSYIHVETFLVTQEFV
jgi:hypothetical protein